MYNYVHTYTRYIQVYHVHMLEIQTKVLQHGGGYRSVYVGVLSGLGCHRLCSPCDRVPQTQEVKQVCKLHVLWPAHGRHMVKFFLTCS